MSKYPEMLKITALYTPSSLEVGKVYEVYYVSTDKNNENTTFCLRGNGKGLIAISKNQFEFVEIKIEDKIV